MTTINNVQISEDFINDVNVIIENTTTSKSSKMKDLYNLNLTISEISKIMNVRYNFVYNVISNECRMKDIELTTKNHNNSETVKSKIITMIKDGKTPTEISKDLKCNINMVYKYRKELENGMID